jgi:tetratricopeptide (TPR) repeat protein
MAEALRQNEPKERQNLAVQIDNLRSSAKESFEKGDFKEAKYFLSEMIRINPKDAEALFNRGVMNENLMKASEAISDYTEAIKADPRFHKSYVNRGILLASVGKYREAIQDFNQALEIEPESPETYMNLGTTYGEMGKYSEAIAMFNASIKLNPQNADAYVNRALAKDKANDRKGAEEDMRKYNGLQQGQARA